MLDYLIISSFGEESTTNNQNAAALPAKQPTPGFAIQQKYDTLLGV